MPFRSHLPDVQLSEKSLSEFIFHQIKDLGDKIALVDNSIGGKSLTFKQVYDQSRNCAGYLREAGLDKGDVVGICSPSSLEFPVAMLGILACGGVVTPCNPAYSVEEILQQFQISKPKMVFVYEDCLNTMKEVQRKTDSLEKMFIIGESNEFITMSEMIGDEYSEDFPKYISINSDKDVAILPYSSGTTGLPKSVMLSHRNITSSFLIFRDSVHHGNSDILYSDRPMYHAGGFWGLIRSLSMGQKLVLEKEFDTETMLRAIEKYKIIDLLTGKELSENKTGEILAQGPQVMKGYMGNPDATARTITKDGWIHTGDIGYVDNDGILYIIDRLKEVIKYKSLQVSPAELESAILKHPKVMDVGVIGIPDTYAGELPKAFVVKKVDNLTKDDVNAFVKSELAGYKQLRGGIEFVKKIPKSATGKIQRIELKKMAGNK
uniref:4-coumarate--CoA ligase-like 5 isoform X2 n=1 Tax=Styela clava TaxID=7725 RepID=UPI0019393CB5|nr:4-coumarate--CoA ligase-like 5 isoform X2 [Styela clava]